MSEKEKAKAILGILETQDLDEYGVQFKLLGMWTELNGGCPHYHGRRDTVGACEMNEMRSCCLEVDESCPTLKSIIEEWKEEYELENKTHAR